MPRQPARRLPGRSELRRLRRSTAIAATVRSCSRRCLSLVQRREVCDHDAAGRRRTSGTAGMRAPCFIAGALRDPAREVRRRVGRACRRRSSPRLARWVRSGPTRPSGVGAAHGVTGAARAREHDSPGRCVGAVAGARAPARRCARPRRERGRRLGGHVERHVRVLQPAVFAAHARETCPDLSRLEPRLVHLPGNDVHLSRDLREPEAVDHVGAMQPHAHRLADREVDLVRRR